MLFSSSTTNLLPSPGMDSNYTPHLSHVCSPAPCPADLATAPVVTRTLRQAADINRDLFYPIKASLTKNEKSLTYFSKAHK